MAGHAVCLDRMDGFFEFHHFSPVLTTAPTYPQRSSYCVSFAFSPWLFPPPEGGKEEKGKE